MFTPPGREGFLFSTDARFSGDGKFKSTAVLERDQRTDAGGAARMSFDTTIEPTAQPRRYSIEATVTGDDGIEVRNVQNVIAVPPFVLGVKTPRYVERPGAVTPELIAINGKGEAVEGLEMTLRFIKRNWISTLQASDFAQGAAKYVTQVQDETLLERKVTSAKEAQKIELEAKDAGVYVVQLEAYDRHRPAPAGQRRLFRRRRHARHLRSGRRRPPRPSRSTRRNTRRARPRRCSFNRRSRTRARSSSSNSRAASTTINSSTSPMASAAMR